MIISGGFSLTGGAVFAIERAPDAPTIGVATANGSTAATVTFTAPTFNGGRTITTYTATSSPGSITGTLSQAGSGTIDVSGLTTGVSYTFTVTATNELGTSSPSSASNSITPAQSIVSNQIATDKYNTYVINTNLSIAYGWGTNEGSPTVPGTVGDNTTITRSTPATIGVSFLSIMGGHYFTHAIKSNGSLWSWGRDQGWGVLGLTISDTTITRSSPTQIGSSTNWIRLVQKAGNQSQMAGAINDLGQLYAWGQTTYGTFGDGIASAARSSPTQIPGSWVQASIGSVFAIGIKTDGTLWSWGINTLGGTVGDNTTITRLSPVQIAGSWIAIAGGDYFALGIKSDNTLWSWGYNFFGQLGANIPGGNTNNRSSPVQIGSNSNWTKVAAGADAAMAYNSSNQLFVWGRNEAGATALYRVGDGTSINRSSPVQIGTTWG